MAISLKMDNLKRYKDIVSLLVKHWRSDIVKAGSLGTEVDLETVDASVRLDAEALTTDLEKMGPTFIKFGQLLSTRTDLLPPAYTQALTRLQDNVGPFPFEEVERIVSSELGVRISKAFADFDEEPLAAASLGQVHRATLRDGRHVAVKVQRPNIHDQIVKDLDLLEEVAGFLEDHTEAGKRYELRQLLQTLRQNLLHELDYTREAGHLRLFGENLRAFVGIVVPKPIESYSTARVLTMEYVRGTKITGLSNVARTEIDGRRLADLVFHAYLQQILVDGVFHADPHPGNIQLTEDGRIALFDLGMVARVTPGRQEDLFQLLLAVSERRSVTAADRLVGMSEQKVGFDPVTFRRHVALVIDRHYDMPGQKIDTGVVIADMMRTSGACGLGLPPELLMLGKMLLNLDQVVYALDPDFDPSEAMRRYAGDILQKRMAKGLTSGNVLATAMEAKEFLEKMPARLNRVLDLVADNAIEVKVDAIDERLVVEGLQKVANRITVGLVLAALIVGASMLMKIETSFTILGYPGLAMLFFVAAAGGGLVLVFNTLLSDIKARRKSGGK
jgi:predicted unusual protein kinase regulating ubiquinone biosynthesis (AarF/ABC1/UbiB family)